MWYYRLLSRTVLERSLELYPELQGWEIIKPDERICLCIGQQRAWGKRNLLGKEKGCAKYMNHVEEIAGKSFTVKQFTPQIWRII